MIMCNDPRSWTKLNLSSQKDTSKQTAIPLAPVAREKDDIGDDISETISLEDSKRLEEREGIINDDEYED